MKKINPLHRFIFKALKSSMVALTYEEPVKAPRPELTFVFRCSDGLEYFMWNKPDKMPILRQADFIKAYNEFIFKFTNIETDTMMGAISKAVKSKVPDLGMVYHILAEYDTRQSGIFFSKSSFYELLAICLVNDHEPIEKLLPEWKEKKLKVFEHDFEAGLKSAIYGSPLKTFIPQIEDMEGFLSHFFEEANIQTAAFSQQLNSYVNGR